MKNLKDNTQLILWLNADDEDFIRMGKSPTLNDFLATVPLTDETRELFEKILARARFLGVTK